MYDRAREEAHHVAEELRHGYVPQAMNEIQREMQSMPPHEALRFARELNRETGGRSPLQETRDQYGRELLTLPDAYGRQEVVKVIPQEQPPMIARPMPQYGNPVAPLVQGLELGVGIVAGRVLGNALFGNPWEHRRR